MSSFTGTVTVGTNDYDDSSNSNTVIRAVQNQSLSIDRDAYIILDTDIGSDVIITAATFYWYDHDYIANGTTEQGDINILSGALYTSIYDFTSWASGWKSHALTSQELNSIINTGNTYFRLTVDDPGSKASRSWGVRAYEYSGDYSAYMIIEYDEVVVQRKRRIFIIG